MTVDEHGSYRAVLRDHGTRTVLLAGLLVTAAQSGRSVALLLTATQAGRGLGAAGILIGASSLGAALAAPVRGRLVDSLGYRTVLLPMVVAHTMMWALVAVSISSLGLPVLVGLAVLAGLLFPPVFACCRAALSSMVRGAERFRTASSALMAGQAVAQVSGPLLVGVAATVFTPVVSFVVVLTSTAASVALIMRVPVGPRPSAGPLAHSTLRRLFGPLLAPGMTLLLVTSFLEGAVGGGLLLVAATAGSPDLDGSWGPGLLVGGLALGNVVGTLVYGRARPRRPGRLAPVLLTAAALCAGAIAFLPGGGVKSVAIVLLGVLSAPLPVVIMEGTRALSPSVHLTEIYAWIGSAGLLGVAVVSPVTAALLDDAATAACGLLALCLGISAVCASWLQRSLHRRSPVPEAAGRPDPPSRR